MISMIAESISSLISISTSSTWACTVTSRAVVGSSAISRSGLHVIAMAIIARWRMPPENSWGCISARCAGCGMPTRSSISTARAHGLLLAEPVVDPGHLGDLAAHGVHRVERRQRVLEDHRDLPAAHLRASASSLGGEQVLALPEHSLAGRSSAVGSSPRMLMAVTDLPEPDSPTIGEHLAAADVEADAVDGLDHAGVGAERRVQVAHRQQDLALGAAAPARRSARLRRRGSPLELRVEGVAQAVTDEHEGQHGQEDGRRPGRTTGAGRWPGRPCPRRPSAPTPGSGACGPTPRNDSAASARITPPIGERAVHDDRLQGVGQDVAGT